jgi:hypothetical protein
MNLGIGLHLTRANSSSFLRQLLGLSPLAYWPLDEASGSTCNDRSGNGRNGTYSNVTLAQSGQNGRTSASFNGTNSKDDVYSAGLSAAFPTTEGTLLLWAKVSGAGVWTDATTRGAFRATSTDGASYITMRRPTDNNLLQLDYYAGAVNKRVSISTSTTAWFHLALSWSVLNDQVIAYYNGIQYGATLTALGTWTNAINVAFIGCSTATPAQVWSGYLQDVILFNRPLSALEVAKVKSFFQ